MIAKNGSTHKVEVSWEQVMDGLPQPETPTQRHFRDAVVEVSERAKAALPDSHGHIERGVALTLAGAVRPLEDGKTYRVDSASTPGRYYVVNGHCPCTSAQHAPKGWCKHRLAAGLYRRATVIAQEREKAEAAQGTADPFAPETTPALEVPALQHVPAWGIVTLHGKQFVTFGALLAMAHERGLVSLKAAFISVTPELALASAEATLADGRTVTEAADATPQNVHSKVAQHFARCALTRAKGRALRDLLNIPLVCAEELD